MGEIQLILDKIPVFLPISSITVAWEFIILLYIVLDFSLTILVTCFPSDTFLGEILYHYFDRILVILLVLDILFSLNTCIIRKGVVISERKAIAADYLKSVFFIVDVVSLIFSILQLIFNSAKNYQNYYNFIVFIKIVKVYQFDRNIKRYGLKSFNSLLIYEILKNIAFLALMCHVIGCFAYLLDYNLMTEDYYNNMAVYWLVNSFAYANLYLESFWVRYTYSFYYSTSILSGIAYGDLVPLNPIETVYNLFILLLPLVIYSYIFNAIYDVISKKRERNKRIKKYQFLSKRYFKTLRVKKALQIKLITYLSYVFKKTISSSDFVGSLAPSARSKYLSHTIHAKFDFFIFQQLLSISPITNKNLFKSQLVGLINEQSFPERYKMIVPPSKIKLYYINQGICKRVTLTDVKYSDDITRKQYACFYPFLTGLITPKLRYQSASFVVCQSINRDDFLAMLKDRNFSQLKEAFFLMKQEKLMYNNETVMGENCFFCQNQSHFLTNCNYLRPKANPTKLTHDNQRKRYKRRAYRPKKIQSRMRRNEELEEKGIEQMGVQCCADKEHLLYMKYHEFQTIAHMRIYYANQIQVFHTFAIQSSFIFKNFYALFILLYAILQVTRILVVFAYFCPYFWQLEPFDLSFPYLSFPIMLLLSDIDDRAFFESKLISQNQQIKQNTQNLEPLLPILYLSSSQKQKLQSHIIKLIDFLNIDLPPQEKFFKISNQSIPGVFLIILILIGLLELFMASKSNQKV